MKRALIQVGWPSFLAAGLLEMLVFSAAHPEDMKGFGGLLTQLSASGVYTLAFLCFWAICALGTALALMLAAPAPDDPWAEPPGRG